jgi:protein gp37
MQKTAIEWTDFSSNPLKYRRKSDGKIVGACVKVSPGCANCYSEKISLRFDRGKLYNSANMEELEPFLDQNELHNIIRRSTCQGLALTGRKVFIGDMTDVFGEWVADEMLDQLFGAMAMRPDVTFQVLTKRARRMREYFASYRGTMLNAIVARDLPDGGTLIAPLPNVWLGVSVENQSAADERILHLLQTPAAVRFVSAEPLLGHVDLWQSVLKAPCGYYCDESVGHIDHGRLDWVICGGESGPRKRPFDLEWARSLRDECRAQRVPFFMKQVDKVKPIPDDLLVREFPSAAVVR